MQTLKDGLLNQNGCDHSAVVAREKDYVIERFTFLYFSVAVPINNILTNLVKNALKFTHKGRIEFGYRLKSETNELEFFVKDTGDGIDSSMLEIVFERFRQTSETTAKNTPSS